MYEHFPYVEADDVIDWKRGLRFASDQDDKCAEWAWVPSKLMDDGHGSCGWMKMDRSGQGMRIGMFAPFNRQKLGTACVRYVATSIFSNEVNTVLFCKAQSLLRSKDAADVAKGEKMMKGFFLSDDAVLRSLAMGCCIERGLYALEDFGTNATAVVRLAAIRRGDEKAK